MAEKWPKKNGNGDQPRAGRRTRLEANLARGRFIVIEGLDGAGSTTQAALLRDWFTSRQRPVHLTWEPTDGPVGSLLRLILARPASAVASKGEPYQLSLSEALIFEKLFPAGPKERLVCLLADRRLDAYSLALLFAADRTQHVYTDILPKLKGGTHIVCDRYYLSSLAYQTTVRGVDLDWVFSINSKSTKPDLTIFLDVPAPVCAERMKAQRAHVELYEALPKLEAVRLKYLEAIAYLRQRGESVEVVPGDRPVEAIHADVVALVEPLLYGEDAPR